MSRASDASKPKKLPMSVKQFSQAVRNGRKVEFLIFDGDPITGYLSGMDDDYFYVLSPSETGFTRWLVRRSGNPAIQLYPESTYDSEPQHDAMEEIIRPFRAWFINHVNGNSSDADVRKAG